MKVLLLNGSPHSNGSTNRALQEVAETLEKEGIQTEIFQIGINPVSGCRACHACTKLKRCVIDDKVNEFVEKAREADGFVFGSPVHYGSAGGSITSFLDRAFFSVFLSGRGEIFKHKPGTAVACARRSGTTATLDQLNKYFTISEMPVISGRYWNMVHGYDAKDVEQDLEGLQNMRILARNFAWHLKCHEAGKKAGIEMPKQEEIVFTNFIR